MNPEPHGFSSETQDIIEDVIEYLKNGISQEELQLLLSEDQDWERFQVEADLSRDEADILHEALNKLRMDTATEDKDMLQKEQLDRDRFLDEFPMVKMELEERISELHALADKVDKTHRDCTISYLVANSVGAFSGVLTILGLALAPVTAGVSLALSATGMGLGTAAAITSVSTSIVDHSNRLSAKASASKLMLTGDHESVVKAVLPSLVPITKNCIQVSSKITKTVHAIKLAKDNPRLVANARRLMTTGNISKRRGPSPREGPGKREDAPLFGLWRSLNLWWPGGPATGEESMAASCGRRKLSCIMLHWAVWILQKFSLEIAVHSFQRSDQVLLQKWKDLPLQPEWTGPFTVLLSAHTAVKLEGVKLWSHHSRVKPCPAYSEKKEWKVQPIDA
ncbi:apolipoprotein L2-like isoform 1-T2 [Trichechus inunguis]